jgi:hypothetical protein
MKKAAAPSTLAAVLLLAVTVIAEARRHATARKSPRTSAQLHPLWGVPATADMAVWREPVSAQRTIKKNLVLG